MKTVYKGNYIEVTEEDIYGHIYERVTLGSGVKVYPIKDNRVLAIKEFRPQEGKSFWKFVSGWHDKPNKTHLEVAQEELAEEVGMKGDTWIDLYNRDYPGATVNAHTKCFVVKDVEMLKTPPVNPDIEVIEEFAWLTHDELQLMIDNKEMRWDSDTFCALQALRLFSE